jgi:hypothetical protein
MLGRLSISIVAFGSVALAFSGPTLSGEDVTSTAIQDPAPRQQTDIVVTMMNAGSNTKVGIPDFLTGGASPALQAAAKAMADVLEYDLNFEASSSCRWPGVDPPRRRRRPFQRWPRSGRTTSCSARCARPRTDAGGRPDGQRQGRDGRTERGFHV